MTDLTPFFFKCVTIYQEDLRSRGLLPEGQKGSSQSTGTEDSFLKEARKLNEAIKSVRAFVDEIRAPYLLNSTRESGFSVKQKDEIDSHIGLELNQLSKSLQHIEKYEQKRAELEKARLNVPSAVLLAKSLFNRDLQMSEELKVDTVNLYRSRVIRYLSLKLADVSSGFLELKEKRQSRQMEFQKSSLNTTTVRYDDFEEAQQITPAAVPQAEIEHHNEVTNTLSTDQLQVLQQENTEMILNLKSQELDKVTQLESSVFDISNLVHEIGMQLQNQTDMVDQLLDHQDDMLQDVTQGNKQLIKAKERNDKNARRMFWIIIIMGIMLLTIDFLL